MGSFSKSFMPGLRIGFLVADRPMVEDLKALKRFLDLGGPPLTQAIMARFLQKGYARHIEKMKPYYRKRGQAVCRGLKKGMPEGVKFSEPEGGFQLWVQLPLGYSAIHVFLQGLERGVAILPGSAHDLDGRFQNCFRIVFGHETPADLGKGVMILGDIVSQALAKEPMEPTATGLGTLV